MMTQPPQLDPVSVLVMLAAWVFSPAVAAVLGPYVVICIASTVGAYWSLGIRDSASHMSGLGYFLSVNIAAALLTVLLASLAKPYVPANIDERWLFAPIALGIGLGGERWPRKAYEWVMCKLRKLAGKADSP